MFRNGYHSRSDQLSSFVAFTYVVVLLLCTIPRPSILSASCCSCNISVVQRRVALILASRLVPQRVNTTLIHKFDPRRDTRQRVEYCTASDHELHSYIIYR